MQIFIPYSSPIETAKCLDKKRLNKQIIECQQILNVFNGTSLAWKNHPVTKMYANNADWVELYRDCLLEYRNGNIDEAVTKSMLADQIKPAFLHNQALLDQHKKRLYTKDQNKYKQFESYGISYENWYVINDEIKIYRQNSNQ